MNAHIGQAEDELADPLKSVIESIAGDQPDKTPMDSFLSTLKEHPPIRSLPRRSARSKPIRSRLLATLISTAAMIAILLGWHFLPTANALENIAKALANVPCIKATTIVDHKKSERWLVASTDQTALRNDQQIEFADGTAGTLVTYDLRTKELVKSFLPEKRNSALLVELVESLAAIGRGDVPKSIRGMTIKAAKVDRTGVRRSVHLDLLSQDGEMSGSAMITLQDNGDLPIAGVVNLSKGNMSQQIETTWEYPANGPADIFELGVPPGTPLIDRIPTPAVKQLVAAVYKGRLEFDDYRAVVFATISETLHDIDVNEVSLVSKKANQLVVLRNADELNALEGQGRAQVAAQILADPQSIRWVPSHFIDGQTLYSFNHKLTTGVHISRSQDIAAGFIVPAYERVPHLVGRPATGIGLGTVGATLELSDETDSADSVLLRTHQSLTDEDPPSPVQRLRSAEYWIAKTQDFLVLRTQSLWEDGSTSVVTIGDLVQSPSGKWYPKIASRSRDDGSHPTVHSYHVDFSGPLPKTMFDVNDLVRLVEKTKRQ
jgi:hypothetical protein